MTQYAKVNDRDWVVVTYGAPDPGDMGPYEPLPFPDRDEEGIWHRCSGWDWKGRISETAVVVWNNGSPQWVEVAPLADVAARVIAAMDAEGDAARLMVIGDPTKAIEYQRAEAQARSYAAAGYPDPVPPCVESWALAKRWTNGGEPWTGRRAADDINATADRWNAALEGIRGLRLDAKEHARAVLAAGGAPAEVEAIGVQFSNDLSDLMKGIA
jgi:hypothetical protein